jgi:hypothetical protein
MRYYYYDEDLYKEWEEDLYEDWNEEWDEELYDDENGTIEYMYGLDEKTLRNKLAPDPRENPTQFSKIGVFKLENLAKQYKYLIIEIQNDTKPNAKLFYTVRFWWVNADRSRKKLVDWAIYGPTSSQYIAIPVSDIVGIYRLKGYHISSDIFIEYRADEEVSRFGWKVLERRFALAKFTQEEKRENKSNKPSETQKPKEQTSKPQKPESKPEKPISVQPVQPVPMETVSQGIPTLWIIAGLGIVGALIFWFKIKNRR